VSIYQRDPAAPGANVKRRQAATQSDRLATAVARFNASEAARTAAGLSRSLGPARASVGAVAGSASEVRITVAWELCWYQWGVDLGDEQRSVFEIAKGGEVEQLDGSARQWNASVARGVLAVGRGGARARLPRRARWLRQR
jgi:hypothetical protein